MALTTYNVKKWVRMILGKSKLHVNQGLGEFISSERVNGYYNDLREKVIMENSLSTDEIPETMLENGNIVFFPTAVFQYGLGSYDMFLEKKDEEYLERFYTVVNWTIKNQNADGSWQNFPFSKPSHPFSCMSQGEGASLLIRAYVNSKNDFYLDKAKKAIDFMLDFTIEKENSNKIVFLEYTDQSAVLNGWIFALFGLYDYVLISGDSTYEDIFINSIISLKNSMSAFDLGYWSSYNISSTIISSRFYHKLHIAQLKALYILTDDILFKKYYKLFETYDSNILYRLKAFIIKAIQKIRE